MSNTHQHASILWMISKMKANLAFWDLLEVIENFKDLWDNQTTFQALIALQNMLVQTVYTPLSQEILHYLEIKQHDTEDRIREAAITVIFMHRRKNLKLGAIFVKFAQFLVKIVWFFNHSDTPSSYPTNSR